MSLIQPKILKLSFEMARKPRAPCVPQWAASNGESWAAAVNRLKHIAQALAKYGLVRTGQAMWRRVVRGGVEPPTFRFSGGRSYQLSYLTKASSGLTAKSANQVPR